MTRFTSLVVGAACMLAAATTNAAARDNFLRTPENGPHLSQAVVVDRAPVGNEQRGILLSDTNVSVSGARSTPLLFAFGAIGGAMSAMQVIEGDKALGARLGDFRNIDLRAMLRHVIAEPAATTTTAEATTAVVAEATPVAATESASATTSPAMATTVAVAETAAAPAGPSYELVPLVHANFTDGTHFTYACFVNASFAVTERRKWLGRGQASVTDTFDTASPESMASATAALEPCMREAYQTLALYIDHYDHFSAPRGVVFGAARPVNLPVDENDVADRIVVNDLAGAASYQRSAVTLQASASAR